MQGRPLDERELLDAESVAGHLVEPGSVFGLLADQRRLLFQTAMFDDLFPSGRGRPSIPVDIVAYCLVLESLHGLSDREALAALRTDLRWKVATGLPIGHAGFDPSTLTYWRKRLAASGDPHRIVDAVLKVVAETGVLKGKNRRALDSTILDDAVATQDTVTQLIAIIRKVPREIPRPQRWWRRSAARTTTTTRASRRSPGTTANILLGNVLYAGAVGAFIYGERSVIMRKHPMLQTGAATAAASVILATGLLVLVIGRTSRALA